MFGNIDIYVSAIGSLSRIAVLWEYAPPTQDLNDWDVFVQRGEAPTGLVTIAQALPAMKHTSYLDEANSLSDQHKILCYRLVLKNRKTGEVFESPIQTWEGESDVVARFVIGEHNFKFRRVSGVPCAIFKKMHDGRARCPDCWNDVAKRTMKASCTTCNGTGWFVGWYDPIYVWVDLSPESKAVAYTGWGESQPSQLDILFSDYPRLRPGDMIVEIVPGKRWAVSKSQDMERRRRPMLQVARLDQIERGDIEYALEIPEAFKVRAVKELNELRRNPLSL